MDISKISSWGWQLMVAGGGLVFSISALRYNHSFIHLGLITFAYGVIAQLVDNACWNLYSKDKNKLGMLYVLNGILLVAWLISALVLLPNKYGI